MDVACAAESFGTFVLLVAINSTAWRVTVAAEPPARIVRAGILLGRPASAPKFDRSVTRCGRAPRRDPAGNDSALDVRQ